MIILWESANVALARESASILIATKSASTVQAREIASVFFVAKIKEITKHTLPQPTATLHLSEPSCTQPEISLPHTSATSRDMKMVVSQRKQKYFNLVIKTILKKLQKHLAPPQKRSPGPNKYFFSISITWNPQQDPLAKKFI